MCILTTQGTAVRAALTYTPGESDDDILVTIAKTGDRTLACEAISGVGLCLAGVGYDLADLARDKLEGKSRRKNPPKGGDCFGGSAPAESDEEEVEVEEIS